MSWKMILSFPFRRWGNKGQISYSKRKLWDWTQVFLTPKLMPFASSIFGIVLSTSYYILCLFLGTSGCFHPSPVQPWLTHWTAAGNLWVTTWDESYEVLPWLAETDAPYKYWEILPYRVRILKLAWKARFANKVPFKKTLHWPTKSREEMRVCVFASGSSNVLIWRQLWEPVVLGPWWSPVGCPCSQRYFTLFYIKLCSSNIC